MSLKLYGGNGHRVNKSGKGRNDARDDYYDYDPRYYDSRNGYDARYDDRNARYDARYDNRNAPQNVPPNGGYRNDRGYGQSYDGRYGYDDYGEAAPPPKKKKSGLKVFGIVMLVLALLIGGAFAYWTLTTKAPKKAVTSPSAGSPATPEDEDQSEKVNGGSDRYYTLLIVGKDVAGMNTDTMMLCRYDSVDHKLNVCSLPRDTLTNISAGNKKLNNAYGYSSKTGDVEKLLDSVEDIAGFRPDNYVMIDTDIFVQMIDKLGGVDFDVPTEMFYNDEAQNLAIALNKGWQHLNGEQTMGCFRFRDTYANADLQRIQVQHDLIKACTDQWLGIGNWAKLMAAAKLLVENAHTDLSYGNMQWYAKEFMQLSSDGMHFSTAPCTGCWIRRYAYATLNVDEWMTMVNAHLNPTDTPIRKENCNILYQIRPEKNKSSISAENYAVTNGGPIAGGIGSFKLNDQ